MSNPLNPLDSLISYDVKHVLLAFDNSSTASSYACPPGTIGKCGDKLKGLPCGSGFVIVNELEDDSYKISHLDWSFDFFSPMTTNTTISAGSFTIADSRGNQFPSFLRRISKKLKTQESRITYYLQTFFIGRNSNNLIETHTSNPLIFIMTDSATGFNDGLVNLFTFNFAFLFNTVAQLPNYSRLDQFTITNSENNPSKTTPSSYLGKAEILSRKVEDQQKKAQRQARMNKSAPMRNLSEVFRGFEAELRDMKFTNKRQLQEFLSVVRDDAVKKIRPPKTSHVAQELPITFTVKLDEIYKNYPVDNRNLLTEQTETKQSSDGISSITIAPGSNIFSAVEELMKLSTRTGSDVLKGYGFKVVTSSETDCEGITNHTILVKRYKIPKNKQGVVDTGPDEKGTVKALELSYMDDASSLDVLSVNFAASPGNDFSILEKDSDDFKNDPLFASSQREQITFERPEKGGFSGLRVAASPMDYGLQSAFNGIMTDSLKYRYALAQNTLSIIEMVGNLDLYSDLARNPAHVSNEKVINAKLYKMPEFYPMYVTVKVRIGNTASFTNNPSKGDEDYWYHTYHYHLSGVTNTIVGGKFVQTLRLLSSDDAI